MIEKAGKAKEAASRGAGGNIIPADVRMKKNMVTNANERESSAGSDGRLMGMGDWLLAIMLFGDFDSVIGGGVGRCGGSEWGGLHCMSKA